MNTGFTTPKHEPNDDLSFLNGIVVEDVDELKSVFAITNKRQEIVGRWVGISELKGLFSDDLGL